VRVSVCVRVGVDGINGMGWDGVEPNIQHAT
jgi:hypothetical protein